MARRRSVPPWQVSYPVSTAPTTTGEGFRHACSAQPAGGLLRASCPEVGASGPLASASPGPLSSPSRNPASEPSPGAESRPFGFGPPLSASPSVAATPHPPRSPSAARSAVPTASTDARLRMVCSPGGERRAKGVPQGGGTVIRKKRPLFHPLWASRARRCRRRLRATLGQPRSACRGIESPAPEPAPSTKASLRHDARPLASCGGARLRFQSVPRIASSSPLGFEMSISCTASGATTGR
jgi:hypothetical protein